MDLDPGTLFAALVVSTIGLSLFLYGKKQARGPQLVGGLWLMIVPAFVSGALVLGAVAAATVSAIWLAARRGL